MQLPSFHELTLGCDPEIFVSYEVGKVRKRRVVVGSEAILPPNDPKRTAARLVRDGVQVELHPDYSWCRANLSNSIQACFRQLDIAVKTASKRLNLDLKVDFRSVVRLSKGDLAKMSPETRQLGCQPSKNVYGRKHIQKDGTKYLIRSAAGHIHLGSEALTKGKIDHEKLIKIMDVLVGNTSVMIDRDQLAAERRKVYGRAGEWRVQPHGIEYRTLSNFWLHNYRLMSLVTGLAKTAFKVSHAGQEFPVHYGTWNKNWFTKAEQVLMGDVDLRLIEQAINTNDFELARSNYERWVKPFFKQVTNNDDGLAADKLEDFDHFVNKIRQAELDGAEQPLNVWFPEDPLTHWMTKKEGHGRGWETYLQDVVMSDRLLNGTISGVIAIPTTKEIKAMPFDNFIGEAPIVGAHIIGGM
jgi:hypothetical protein